VGFSVVDATGGYLEMIGSCPIPCCGFLRAAFIIVHILGELVLQPQAGLILQREPRSLITASCIVRIKIFFSICQELSSVPSKQSFTLRYCGKSTASIPQSNWEIGKEGMVHYPAVLSHVPTWPGPPSPYFLPWNVESFRDEKTRET